MASVRVSVIVVNYRTPELTERAACSALDDGADEVIVVDNDDTGGHLERLTSLDHRLSVVTAGRNGGFGAGANLGAARAMSDVLVFLNSDARFRPGALHALAASVDREGGNAIVGPRLVSEDGRIQRSAGLVPRPDDLLIRGLGLHLVAGRLAGVPAFGRFVRASRIGREYELAVTATAPIEVSMVSGACLAVGRSAFASIGGFDERYFMYFEDADLCRRASGAGWPIRYLPTAVVDHVGGASSSADYRFGPWHAASMTRYLRAWHGLPGVLVSLSILWLRALGHAVGVRPNADRAIAALKAGLGVAVRERQ